MKFRFCGDGDCPDWVLAEINSTLSTLSVVKLKVLTQIVVKTVLGDLIPEDKLIKMFPNSETDLTPMKAAVACVQYLILNSTRHGADEATLNEELQQLGLPKEHASAMCRVRTDFQDEITKYLERSSLKVNALDDLSFSIPADTAIDCATLHIRIANEIVNGRRAPTEHKVNIGRTDVALLLNELRQIDRILGEYDKVEDSGETMVTQATSAKGN